MYAKIHKGISNVVKIIKNNEIPSTPTVKFRFKEGTQNNWSTYWNWLVDLSNQTHKNRDKINVENEKNNAVIRNNWKFHLGINNKKKAPIMGKTKR